MKPFKKIINSINRSAKVEQLYFYKVEMITVDMLDKLLSSSVTEGDVFGIEYYINKDEITSHVFTTPSMRMPDQEVEMEMDNKYNYQIAKLKHSTFFPIFTERKILLPQYLSQLSKKLLNDEEIIIQFKMHKRQYDWRGISTNQLDDYLHGIDSPTSNQLIRKVQSHLYEKESIRKISEDKFNALERKIREDNFRVEIIIGTFANSDDREEYLIENINEIFSKYNHMNQFSIEAMDNIEIFHTPTFQGYDKQYLSISEIYCLTSQENMGNLPELPQNTPIFDENDHFSHENEQKTAENKQIININTEIKTPIEAHKAIELLPSEEKVNQKLDKYVVENILNSVNRVGASKDKKLVFDEQIQGSTLTRVTFEMPKGINLTDITKKEKDLKAALGTENLTITQGSKPNTVAFFIPNENRNVVYLKKMLQNPSFAKFAETAILPFIVGEDEIGNPLYADFTEMPHLLEAGATKSGKSVWISQLLLTLILIKKPEELMIYIIDPKMVDFQCFNGFPHVKNVLTDLKKAFEFLSSLEKQMEQRYEKMSKKGHRNIVAYNKNESDKMPYLLCAIDEYNSLMIRYPDVETFIERIGAEGRACGVHLLVATQRPDKDVISGVVKTNLPSVISFKLKTTKEYEIVFGKGQPYRLLGRGHGVMSLEGQMNNYIQFQSACIHPDSDIEVEAIGKVRAYLNGQISVEDASKVDPIEIVETPQAEEVIEEYPIDKLKRIIANTGETRKEQLRDEMGIGMTKMTKLYEQLVDEGWLQKHSARSRGYELIVDNDELNKWREHPIKDELIDVGEKDSDIDDEVEGIIGNEKTEEQMTREELLKKIDDALRDKDKDAFLKYTEMLNKLGE